jgi:Ca-activated chloride channel family protein
LDRRAAFFFVTAIILTCSTGKSGENRQQQNPVFRVGVDTVFVNVSVTDPLNRCITGLSKEDFKVYEDKVQQEISIFRQHSSPVSIGILLDSSGSMRTNNNMLSARAALRRFLADVNPKDEFFLIAFNQNATLVNGFTSNAAAVLNEGALRQPSGRTAIWDAVYRGLDLLKTAKNEKKALISEHSGAFLGQDLQFCIVQLSSRTRIDSHVPSSEK